MALIMALHNNPTCPHLSSLRNTSNGNKKTLDYLEKRYVECLSLKGGATTGQKVEAFNAKSHIYACMQCSFVGSRADPGRSLQRHMISSSHFLGACLDHHHLWCARCGDVVFDEHLEKMAMSNIKRKLAKQPEIVFENFIPKLEMIPQQPGERSGSAIEDCLDKSWLLNVESRKVPTFLPIEIDPSSDTSGQVMAAHGLRGLFNLGNTCFMNAVLQSLAHVPLMQGLVLSGCRHTHQKQHSSSSMNGCSSGAEVCCLACELISTLAAMFHPPKDTSSGLLGAIAPHRLLYTSWKRAPHIAGHEQRDAHEFLVALLQVFACFHNTNN
jgi:ubiquitin carboxyl-terminal hydrolase 22/27/51